MVLRINHLKDLSRIDGESMEFEWKIFPGLTTFGLLEQLQDFQRSEQNVELILRTVMSANQLSIYGAAADICTEVSKDTMASGKPEAHAEDPLETMEIPTEPPTADPRTDEQRRRNLLDKFEQQIEQPSGAQ